MQRHRVRYWHLKTDTTIIGVILRAGAKVLRWCGCLPQAKGLLLLLNAYREAVEQKRIPCGNDKQRDKGKSGFPAGMTSKGTKAKADSLRE
jgi:hypothetical protein